MLSKSAFIQTVSIFDLMNALIPISNTLYWRLLVGFIGAPDKPCGGGCADANPKLLPNDT